MAIKYLGHLLRYKRHDLALIPRNDIREIGSLYESTGSDPYFELTSNRQILPRRWVFITYKTEDLDSILAPALFYSKGNGYNDHDVIDLPGKTPGRGCLIRLPYNLKSLKLVPARKYGRFGISEMRCVEVGYIPLVLILSWLEILADLESPSRLLSKVFRGIHYFIKNGPIKARERLITKNKGWLHRRAVTDYKEAAPPVAPEDTKWEELIGRVSPGKKDDKTAMVDVILPVYMGYDETLNCIYNVLTEPNTTGFNLVVINDDSPERDLTLKLRELAGQGLFILHENKNNLGFVKTVNKGMRLADGRDVVLLNSDTEVYNNWLDRMHAAAYSDNNIATVTPFSNNAEICSYPYIAQVNNMQLEVSYRELDEIAHEYNKGRYIEIPTGIGFCMYIRRDCLDEVGYFDEEGFGKGYGEENDFCLRAAGKGWKNLFAPETFVRHVGGSSFGKEKQARVLNAIRKINSRFPGYDQRIQDFLYEDPIFEFRKNIDLGRLKKYHTGKVFLFISHNWGGGTEKHIQEMAALLAQDGIGIYYLRPHPDNNIVATISCPDSEYLPNLPVLDVLNGSRINGQTLREIGISLVHIHSLAGFNERMFEMLPDMMAAAGLEYDITLHDYTMICPRIHLTDDMGRYCGEPRNRYCDACIRRYGTPYGKVGIGSWRKKCHELLQGARMVYVPNVDVVERMKRYYPDIVYSVRPHPEPPAEDSARVYTFRKPGEVVRLGVIGAIGPHKGSYLLQRCARDAQERHLPLEFVVIGYTNIGELAEEPNVTVTGKYRESEIFSLIRKHRIQAIFFPATWPETYSYTLSLALRAGLKPIAFDIGAIADRMKRLGLANQLIPFNRSNSPSIVNDFLLAHMTREADGANISQEEVHYQNLIGGYYNLQ